MGRVDWLQNRKMTLETLNDAKLFKYYIVIMNASFRIESPPIYFHYKQTMPLKASLTLAGGRAG